MSDFPVPSEIRYNKKSKMLTVVFGDGQNFEISAELLRVESPSAEVQGHSPDEKVIVAGRRGIGIMSIEPVGNYGVTIMFDDLHGSGIYSWDTLYRMGQERDTLWQNYLTALAERGLTRDPPSSHPKE